MTYYKGAHIVLPKLVGCKILSQDPLFRYLGTWVHPTALKGSAPSHMCACFFFSAVGLPKQPKHPSKGSSL